MAEAPARWAYSERDQRWHLLRDGAQPRRVLRARCGHRLPAGSVYAQAYGLKCPACFGVLRVAAAAGRLPAAGRSHPQTQGGSSA